LGIGDWGLGIGDWGLGIGNYIYYKFILFKPNLIVKRKLNNNKIYKYFLN
jgi:hypothetical protein